MNVQLALRITHFAIAALLLGAHFLRAGNLALVILCLVAPLLFLYRRRWSLILLQGLAYCAAASWIATAVRIIGQRESSGQSWTTAAIILGAVALFTFLAGLLLNSRSIKERYSR